MNKQENEIINNMEFLLTELQKEWEKTGAVKALVFVLPKEVEVIGRTIQRQIEKLQEAMDSNTGTFEERICLSKESYVLFRLAGKIKKRKEEIQKERTECGFSVTLDKEELILFETLIGRQIARRNKA